MSGRKSQRAMTALCVVVTLAASYALTANRTDVARAQASERDIAILHDGIVHHVRSTQTTVGATLKEVGVVVGPADRVRPSTNTRLTSGMTVRVVRVTDKVITVEEPIAFATRREPTKRLRVGLSKVTSEGKPGAKRLYYRVRSVDGVEKPKELIRAEVVAKPKPRVIVFGQYGSVMPSRGGFVSRRVLNMHATAYDPGPRSCGRSATGRTCTGMRAGYGVVAVDPRVIRLGSRLYVEGYGYAIAGDRGSAIKGHRIDLGFETYHQARRYGMKHVTVHVLE